MQDKGIVYSLVSRGRDSVLSSYSPYSGNFAQVALQVLNKCKFHQNVFDRFVTAKFSFYTLSHQGFIFLVMVDSGYELRIAASFLKNIQRSFFKNIPQQTRNNSKAHSLQKFNKILKQKMNLYLDKSQVDKLYQLKKHLDQSQRISLQNLDLLIDRGIKLQVLVEKSKEMNRISTDILGTSIKIHKRMWWKNKKVIIGIIAGVLVVLAAVVLVIVI